VRLGRQLAVDFREKFGKDVVIDLVCYRRRGHNEGDDPSMTQPAMYDVIDTKRSVRKSYTESLIGRGDISLKEAEDALRDYQGQLERVFNEVRRTREVPAGTVRVRRLEQSSAGSPDHGCGSPRFSSASATRSSNVPDGFTVHPRVKPVPRSVVRWLATGMSTGRSPSCSRSARWPSRVPDAPRRSGLQRGTFTQRHSVLIDRKTGNEYSPLPRSLPAENGGKFMVYDSALTEYAGWASSTATRSVTPTLGPVGSAVR
jgi:2-oxoglutarate decarboxylase